LAKKKIAAWKKGKWVGVPLTADQQKAQRIMRDLDKKRGALVDALRTVNFYQTRQEAHQRLDKLFDNWERMEKIAVDLFPEVKDSFTIAEMDVRL